MVNTLLVGVGGFAGSALRFVVTELVHRSVPRRLFPAAGFLNVSLQVVGGLAGVLGGLRLAGVVFPGGLR